MIKINTYDDILEVYDVNELPKAPNGKKYYILIGGKKVSREQLRKRLQSAMM